MPLKRKITDSIPVASVADYSLTVDYFKSVEELLSEHYDGYVNPDITNAHFRNKGCKGKKNVGVQLVHFAGCLSYGEASKSLIRMGLRPATMHELLTFGMQYSDVQKQFFVVALGSPWRRFNGTVYVGYLRDIGRSVNLFWFGSGSCGSDRFLVVRE